MEITNSEKIPLFITTQCLNCGNKNRFDLQGISWIGEDGFKYQCVHCKQTNDLYEDSRFVDFARLLSEHQEEYLDSMRGGLAEMASQLLGEKELNLDDELIRELKNLPKDKLKEEITDMMKNKSSEK